MDVLKARTIPGRPQKLSGPQLRQIYTLIVGNDPRQLSFEFALWTREMVRELIRREFNVKLSGCCESWGYHRSVRCGEPTNKIS